MKLEQSFTVEAPLERVWAALIDVERIAPCLPGAEITGVDGSGAYQGTFSVKLGPTTAAYRGTLRLDAVDDAARTATMSAKGTDKRGQGGASATIVSTMREEAGATQVDVLTDFHITGRLARFGRSGMIEDISKRLMREFAQCLQATIEADGSAEPGASAGGAAVVEDDAADAAEAAVASAGGAAAEAASASAAPPGAEKLAEGPAAPAPEPPASPPPLVGRPVDRSAADAEPEPPAEPARTGWLSDWPDDEAAPAGDAPAPERPVSESLSPSRAEPSAPEPPASEPFSPPRAEPPAPEPSAPEPLSPPRAEPPAPEPPTAAPPPPLAGPPPSPELAPAAEPAPAAADDTEEAPVRTESIPPPGRPDRPEPQAAKSRSGASSFFSGLGERVRRLFGRKKT
jgi:carbon monoxide dehydrogenase subunit G